MSGESEERHMGATVSNEFIIDQPDTGTRPDSGHSVEWFCEVINKSSSICLFYSKEPAYLGLKIA